MATSKKKVSIINKKTIGTIVFLSILIGGGAYLYFGDIQTIWNACLDENPDLQYCVYSIERDDKGITQIEMLMHNTLTKDPDDFVRWRFNATELTVYNGRFIAAKSKWYVDYYKTYGTDEWVNLRKKSTKTVLEIEEFPEEGYVILRKISEYYGTKSLSGTGGFLVEEIKVGPEWHKMTVRWEPFGNRMNTLHALKWKIDSFGLGVEEPRVLKDEHFLLFDRDTIVSWLDAAEYVSTATLTDRSLDIIFEAQRGDYIIDPSIGIGITPKDWELFSKDWWNDTGNDSCVAIYSDRKLYMPNLDHDLDVVFKVDNKCGSEFEASIALLVKGKHENEVTIKEVWQNNGFIDERPLERYICKNNLDYGFLAKQTAYEKYYAKCLIDQNGLTDHLLFDENVYSVDDKTGEIVWYSTVTVPVFEEKQFLRSFDILTVNDFWDIHTMKDVMIPVGDSYFKLLINVPIEDGEFIITLKDSTGNKYSILDPTWTGAGSEALPYIITDCQELQDIDQNLGNDAVWFELGNDIDCHGFDWASIGGGTDYFEGFFDGKSYSISNVTEFIHGGGSMEGTFIALIGTPESPGPGGEFRNTALIDFNMWLDGQNGAAPFGICDDCVIENVYVQGGHFGMDGTLYAAGLVTQVLNDSNIINCYSVDGHIITADDDAQRVGGLVGITSGADVNIFNSYSTSFVDSVGDSGNVGGIVGQVASGTCTDLFWDVETSNWATSDCGTGATTAVMYKQNTFDGNNWDFSVIWEIEEDANYPTLLSFGPIDPPIVTVNDFNKGWQNTDANLQFNCSSDGSCVSFFYSLNDVNYIIPWLDGNIGIVLDYDYNHEIFYIASDDEDNNSATGLAYLAIDKTPPTSDNNAFDANVVWFISDVNVNIACYDENAGCKNLFYGIVGDANYEFGWGYDLNLGISVTSDGNTEIFYWNDDNTTGVGDNNSLPVYLNIGIDTTVPSITIIKPEDGNQYYDDVLVIFDLNDVTSGIDIANVQVDINGAAGDFDWETDCTHFDTNWYCSYTETDFNVNERDYNVTVFANDFVGLVARATSEFKWIATPSILWGNVNDFYVDDTSGLDLYPSALVDRNVTPSGQNDTNGIFKVTNISIADVNVTLDLNQALPNDSNLAVCIQNSRIGIDYAVCWDINASSPAIILTDLAYGASQLFWWFFDINVLGIPGWEFIVDYQYEAVLS